MWVYFILSCVKTCVDTNSLKWHLVEGPHIWLHTKIEGPWPHYMILEVCWDGLWALSFGLSQFCGHGSWIVCELALSSSVNRLHHKCLPWPHSSPVSSAWATLISMLTNPPNIEWEPLVFLIAHPHLLVWANTEWVLPTLITFSGSYWPNWN
jgi:hypothetical protein